MAEHQHTWPVAVLCEVLAVSRSGFYTYLPRHARAESDAAEVVLFARIQAIAADTRHSDGTRRMATPLQGEGFAGGRAQARRLMRQAGVVVQRPKPRGPVTPESRHGDAVAPNLLARQLGVARPDHVGVGDISDVGTAEGWLYVSTLVDVYARNVVGWAMSRRIDPLWVEDTVRMALGRRQPVAGLLHHSDRGRQ
jgi:putative transposase